MYVLTIVSYKRGLWHELMTPRVLHFSAFINQLPDALNREKGPLPEVYLSLQAARSSTNTPPFMKVINFLISGRNFDTKCMSFGLDSCVLLAVATCA